MLVGTALLSPVLGRPVLAGLGWVYRRAFGAVGLMAEQNARRNPRRTAATASALMIGVALVTMMSVLGASAKASLDQTLAEDIVADFVVSNAVGQAFSASVADEIEGVPGVAAGRPGAWRPSLQIDGDRDFATGVDPDADRRVARPESSPGSLADLDAGSVAISTELRRREGPRRRVDRDDRLRRRRERGHRRRDVRRRRVLAVGPHDVARGLRRHRGATDRPHRLRRRRARRRPRCPRPASTEWSRTCRR